MSGFGRLFRVTTFGESHGGALGVVIEGVPPGFSVDMAAVQAELERRRPGQSKLTTHRGETDQVEVLSGMFEGKTLGTSLAMLVRNRDADPRAYSPFKHLYRPSHADYTYDARYGFRAWAGGGRSSARETAARVAAGAVARQFLAQIGIEVVAWVDQVGALVARVDAETVSLEAVESSITRCPDPVTAPEMEELIRAVRAQGDSVGGIVRAVARNVPAGWGDPVFDKLDADLAKAMISLPAAKGFEVGSGYLGATMLGSAHNDPFYPGPSGPLTRTNHSGGIQGGISNGMPITLSVAFKPVATIFKDQETVDTAGNSATIRPRGRHDPCVLPRAVPIVESMMCLVLMDHWLRTRGQMGSSTD